MNQRNTIGKILHGGIRLHFQESRETENFGKLENLENPRAAQIFCQHCICFLRRARGKNRKSFHYKRDHEHECAAALVSFARGIPCVWSLLDGDLSLIWSALEVVSPGCGPLLNSVSSWCGALWDVISLCCGPLSGVVSLGWGPLSGLRSWVLLGALGGS